MIASTIFMMFGYWILLAVAIALVMIAGLYFARVCEFLVDFFVTKK